MNHGHEKACPVPRWENNDGHTDITPAAECYMCGPDRPRCKHCGHDMNSNTCELVPVWAKPSRKEGLSWACDCKPCDP